MKLKLPIRSILYIISSVMILFLSLTDSHAQRTSKGQYYFDISATASILMDPSLGGSLGFGQYLLSSRWEVGVDMMLKRDANYYFPVFAEASYLLRFCANRSRSVHLYGGIGILAGVEVSLPEELKLDTGYTNDTNGGVDIDFSDVEDVLASSVQTAFIYGVQPCLEAELFLGNKVALIGKMSIPLTFGSAHKVFNVLGSVGLRFNL